MSATSGLATNRLENSWSTRMSWPVPTTRSTDFSSCGCTSSKLWASPAGAAGRMRGRREEGDGQEAEWGHCGHSPSGSAGSSVSAVCASFPSGTGLGEAAAPAADHLDARHLLGHDLLHLEAQERGHVGVEGHVEALRRRGAAQRRLGQPDRLDGRGPDGVAVLLLPAVADRVERQRQAAEGGGEGDLLGLPRRDLERRALRRRRGDRACPSSSLCSGLTRLSRASRRMLRATVSLAWMSRGFEPMLSSPSVVVVGGDRVGQDQVHPVAGQRQAVEAGGLGDRNGDRRACPWAAPRRESRGRRAARSPTARSARPRAGSGGRRCRRGRSRPLPSATIICVGDGLGGRASIRERASGVMMVPAGMLVRGRVDRGELRAPRPRPPPPGRRDGAPA